MTTQERLRKELAQLVEDYCKSPKEDVLAWIKIHPKAIDSLLQLIETEKIELLDALYWMYTQYCGKGHYFMGAGETASELLENAGYITVDGAGVITKDNGDSEEQRTTLRGTDDE